MHYTLVAVMVPPSPLFSALRFNEVKEGSKFISQLSAGVFLVLHFGLWNKLSAFHPLINIQMIA